MFAVQVSGVDAEQQPLLSVLAKRTYDIGRSGVCNLADEQQPLCLEPQTEPGTNQLLLRDYELFPYKPLTDIVVRGHAYAPKLSVTFESDIRIGSAAKPIRVIGDRMCTFGRNGELIFSVPRPIDHMPLGYERAYGGTDPFAEKKYGNPAAALGPFLPDKFNVAFASPYRYPRNPGGRGYLIEATREAIEALTLPNLEDPDDLLSPERLVLGRPQRWPHMPLPQSYGFVDHGCFPRIAYFGFIPQHDPLDCPIAEVARELAIASIMTPGTVQEKFNFRFNNGASLGLQLPYLRGDESCLLVNLHPTKQRLELKLPGERPMLWTDGRNGKLNATVPVLHTVLIEPDVDRVSLLWCGSAPALRPYLPAELLTMPFRVEW